MKYSFIIPIYNAENYIEKCVENIYEVELQKYEIILIDDGSVDRSPEICDRIAVKNPNVRVIHQVNKGVSAARNAGIECAEGDYIIFLDVDDDVDVARLKQLLSRGEAIKKTDMVIFGVSFDHYLNNIFSYGEELVFQKEGIIPMRVWVDKLPELYACNVLNSVWAKVFKKNILDKYKIRFNPEMFIYEDLDFVLRYMEKCGSILNDSRIIYHYKINEGEVHNRERLKKIQSLNQYISFIEKSFNNLLKNKEVYDRAARQKLILLKLYSVLAREKNEFSTPGQIKDICLEARIWFEKWPLELVNDLTEGERHYLDMLEHKQVARIILRNIYSWVRHQVAIRYKILKRQGKNGH